MLGGFLSVLKRAKRGKGIRRRVVSGTPILGSWKDFLHVDSIKADLFHFLSLTLIDSFNLKKKHAACRKQ